MLKAYNLRFSRVLQLHSARGRGQHCSIGLHLPFVVQDAAY